MAEKITELAEKWKVLPRRKKIQVAVATALSSAFVVSLPVLAWFASQRQTGTIIMINAPTTISIGAGNQEPVGMIDLSNINVEEIIVDNNGEEQLVTEGSYVFCVTGKYMSEYDLQIARTTNIDFDYELYRVDTSSFTIDNESYDVLTGITTNPVLIDNHAIAEYKSELDGNTYYYPYLETSATSENKTQGNITVLGNFLNPATLNTQTVGDGTVTDASGKTFHKRNYGDEVPDGNGGTAIKTYDNVNVYAQPLYWQVKNLPVTGQIGDTGFVDYYVLKIKWGGKGMSNNKETDMIYITARKSVN